MNRLIAIALAPGDDFVSELGKAWDNGDAVAPIDLRQPEAARAALVDHLAPAVVVDATGRHQRSQPRVMESDDALVVTTSGSTGDPKAVVLTHDALAASARATHAYLDVDPNQDRWLCCLPLVHVGGLGVVTRALITGTPLSVHSGFDTGAVLAAAEAGATLTSLVPTTLARIPATAFRKILVGGSAPPPGRPANVIATYGLTETGGGVVYEGWPLDGVEMRIDSGGVIALRGPSLLRCYLGGYDPKDADGWFATGDLGEISDAGQLRVFGRKGDLIISGGENVWPGPVERTLLAHPAIADVAVVGRPHPEWGEQVTAIIVVADGTEPPELAEVREWAARDLAPFAAPRAVEVVPSLPRTSLGKLRRYDL